MLELSGFLHECQPLIGGLLFIVAARRFADGILDMYETTSLAVWRSHELDIEIYHA
jgi:hypothetical protein